jgi:esterase/lipase superfamily enzyme
MKILSTRRLLHQGNGAFAACCALVVLSTLQASCATHSPVGIDQPAEVDRYENLVDVRFVTNRKLVASASDGVYFAGEAGELSGGQCRVGIGFRAPRGDVLRIDTRTLESIFDSGGAGRFVIYVHGYGESLSKSCRRAALLQHRLGLEKRLLLFSWPSSNYLTYAQDAVVLEQSLDSIRQALTQASSAIGAENIVLMAHSMGARGVVDALRAWGSDHGRIGQIIFVAPDIGREAFLEEVGVLREKASEITVYSSDNDMALWLSTTVNGAARLGLTKEMDLQHANLIDVTKAGLKSMSGHTYHIFNPAVAEDLRIVLGTSPADGERAFRRVPGKVDRFWVLEPVVAKSL